MKLGERKQQTNVEEIGDALAPEGVGPPPQPADQFVPLDVGFRLWAFLRCVRTNLKLTSSIGQWRVGGGGGQGTVDSNAPKWGWGKWGSGNESPGLSFSPGN